MLKKYFANFTSAKPQKRKADFYHEFLNFDIGEDNDAITAADYCSNVIVHRCVNILAQAGSHVPWVIYQQKGGRLQRLADHPLYHLLKRPNPVKAGADLFAEIIASKLLFGNSYLLAAGSSYPQELHLLNSNNVRIVCTEGRVSAYHYQTNNKTLIYPVAGHNCHSKVLHLKNYHPTNHLYGLPTIKAAANSIRLHNLTTNWNSSLLKNGARPTGALVMKDNNAYLSEDQFHRLQEQLNDKYSGASNAGKPLLLEGGLDWREMSINPKDMDFIESKNVAAREIALAFGVPPQLLGINGDNTYSNMQEARIALWEETLLPLLDRLSDSLTNWFAAWYGDDIIIDFDRDAISSLTEKRQNIWAKIANANFMTVNEKRALVSLPPITGGDVLA